MAKRIGSKTLILSSSPSIIGYAAVGAKKEKQGPLAGYFDLLSDDSSFGQKFLCCRLIHLFSLACKEFIILP